jgi:hypothetical protein
MRKGGGGETEVQDFCGFHVSYGVLGWQDMRVLDIAIWNGHGIMM